MSSYFHELFLMTNLEIELGGPYGNWFKKKGALPKYAYTEKSPKEQYF